MGFDNISVSTFVKRSSIQPVYLSKVGAATDNDKVAQDRMLVTRKAVAIWQEGDEVSDHDIAYSSSIYCLLYLHIP